MKSKFLLFILIFTFSSATYAQMFSVGGDSGQQARSSSNYFRIGYSPVTFEYDGNTSNPTQDRLDFESPALTFFFETPAISASLSFVNGLTGAEDERYLNLSIDYLNRLSFVKSRTFEFGIPFGLNSNLVNVQNEQMNDDFSQTVFAFGLGGFAAVRVPDKISFALEGIPSYGFSNSRGGLFGGSNKSLLFRARLNFLNIISERNLSLGYDYKFSSYDLDADEFDYDLTYHRITLGISL
ncbi:MAG: hypothetical protein JJ892_14420 [Balneola sp.]|nr:hypothetical protein [Balneola sp.]MBO6649818.1 hypothetical protein [Balneola sp.]MBO6712381.1 hypothetical protein [Balneola sp.]MBO6801468.1 hypothetical protein [Balneola sp.]MBO6871718.1 hypothetical protein [Balneola sp.]